MSDEHKKILVNGSEEKPLNKVKLPLDIEWEKIALEKQREEAAKAQGDEG